MVGRRFVKALLLLLSVPVLPAVIEEVRPRAEGGREGHRRGGERRHEDGGAGDADGARHQQAGDRSVDQVPEDGVDEGEGDGDLGSRVPGEFALEQDISNGG